MIRSSHPAASCLTPRSFSNSFSKRVLWKKETVYGKKASSPIHQVQDMNSSRACTLKLKTNFDTSVDERKKYKYKLRLG